MNLKSLFASTLITASVFGGSPAIGIVTASGHFTVEHSRIWGNSTLFDGSLVETGDASSEISLRNGVKVQLGVASRARVWENRVAIEKGVGHVAAPGSYEVDAAGLKIHAGSATARLRVGLTEPDRVEVTALIGSARVLSGADLLLAAIPTGHSMGFSMQAGASGAVTRTGCLLYKDNHFILQDENTQEVVELNGPDLALNVGNRVEVTGTAASTKPTVSIATSVVNVTGVAPRSPGGCLSVASNLDAKTEVPATPPSPAQPTAPKPTKHGMSTGAKVAIIGGAAGGGLGAALALSGKKSSTSP